MRSVLSYLPFVGLLLGSFFHSYKDSIFLPWYLSLCALVLIICSRLRHVLSASLLICVAYFVLNALYILCDRTNRYSENHVLIKSILATNAAYGALCIILIGMYLLTISRNQLQKIGRFFAFVAVTTCSLTLFGFVLHWFFWLLDWRLEIVDMANHPTIQGIVHYFDKPAEGHGYAGLIRNASVHGGIVACLMPFVWYRLGSSLKQKLILQSLCLLAIVLSFSSIPYGVLFLVGLSMIFMHTTGKRIIVYGVLFTLCVLGLGLIFEGGYLFHSSMRFEAYRLFMEYFLKHSSWAFGTGLSTFQVFSPEIQITNKFMTDGTTGHFFTFLHSDYPLQILFETGIIGVIVFSAAVLSALRRFYLDKNAECFSALVGFIGLMLFDFPVRYFLGALLLGYLGFFGNVKTAVEASRNSD